MEDKKTVATMPKPNGKSSSIGRPAGRLGSLKLEPHEAQIQYWLDIGLSKRRMAKNLNVGFNTLLRFIDRKQLVPRKNGSSAPPTPGGSI